MPARCTKLATEMNKLGMTLGPFVMYADFSKPTLVTADQEFRDMIVNRTKEAVEAAKRIARGGVAGAIVSQRRAVAVLHFDGGVKRHELLHPAVKRNRRRRKDRGRLLTSGQRRFEPIDRLRPQRGHGDGKLGGFMLDGIEPVRVGAGILEQTVARAQGALEVPGDGRRTRVEPASQHISTAELSGDCITLPGGLYLGHLSKLFT